MSLETSGLLLLENKDGSLEIGYCDYNVDFFGGGEYEVNYLINKEDSLILKDYLAKNYKGSLKEMLIAEIGENMSETKFKELLKKLNIQAKRDSWIG